MAAVDVAVNVDEDQATDIEETGRLIGVAGGKAEVRCGILDRQEAGTIACIAVGGNAEAGEQDPELGLGEVTLDSVSAGKEGMRAHGAAGAGP